MEALIVGLVTVALALLHHICSVKAQLRQARTRIASSDGQVDELESQMKVATERIRHDTQRSSELEKELTSVGELNAALTERLRQEELVSKSENQHNAELLSQLKAARREIKELRKVIAERDEESHLSHIAHGELARLNAELEKQLNDALYAVSKETSVRTRVTIDRRKYRSRFESESMKRSEVEEQLRKALLEVRRLSKDLRKLKADATRKLKTMSADAQRIAELESALADVQTELQNKQVQYTELDARLLESRRAMSRIAELEDQNAILERKWRAQARRASNAVARQRAVEAQIKFHARPPVWTA